MCPRFGTRPGFSGQHEAGTDEQLRASLPCDQGTQKRERAAFTGQGKKVDRSGLSEPMPGWQAYDLSQHPRCVRVPAGEPTVEEPQREPDTAGRFDGKGRTRIVKDGRRAW